MTKTELKQKMMGIQAAFGAIRERNYVLNDPVIGRTCNDAWDDAYEIIQELDKSSIGAEPVLPELDEDSAPSLPHLEHITTELARL